MSKKTEWAKQKYHADPVGGAAKAAAWRHANPDKALAISRRSNKKRRAEWRGGMAGRCDVCHKDVERLVRDHNHTTGQLRSLLCHGCNVALGFTYENPAILRRLAEYIERWEHGTFV